MFPEVGARKRLESMLAALRLEMSGRAVRSRRKVNVRSGGPTEVLAAASWRRRACEEAQPRKVLLTPRHFHCP